MVWIMTEKNLRKYIENTKNEMNIDKHGKGIYDGSYAK